MSVSAIVVGVRDKNCCGLRIGGIGADCRDVVVNHDDGECAFVDDIDHCQYLPVGWEKLGTGCGYPNWRDDITCLTEDEMKEQQQTAFRQEIKDKLITALIVFGITLVFGAYFYIRKTRTINPGPNIGAKK